MMVATTIVALGQASTEEPLSAQNRNRAMIQASSQENVNEEATPQLNRTRAMEQVSSRENVNEEKAPLLNRIRNEERATAANGGNGMSAGVLNSTRSAQRSETQVALAQAKRQNNMIKSQALRQNQSSSAMQSHVRSQMLKSSGGKGKGR